MLGLNFMRRLALGGFRLKRRRKNADAPATLTAELPITDSKAGSVVLVMPEVTKDPAADKDIKR